MIMINKNQYLVNIMNQKWKRKISKPWLFGSEMKYTHKAASYEDWQICNPPVLLICDRDVMDMLEEKPLIGRSQMLRKWQYLIFNVGMCACYSDTKDYKSNCIQAEVGNL